MKDHVMDCDHLIVPCPHNKLGCTSSVRRASMAAHLQGCPFERYASFMVATLSRLEALEAENRALRSEFRVMGSLVRFLEENQPHPCVDCGSLFRERDLRAYSASDHASEIVLERSDQAAAPAAPCESASQDLPLLGWPARAVEAATEGSISAAQQLSSSAGTAGARGAAGAAATPLDELDLTAASDGRAARKPWQPLLHPVCLKHRRDDEHWMQWRQHKRRFLADSNRPRSFSTS
eukprot:CAMPEP_0119318550 /NCGR_PEP_ID=MMETSP1333-20130426/46743_1 /TAXON_ID=418940 /ORGANISM="Scyphosphaera apsteinii, Strain RCC1455" /LENGTH=235 /DNA_ID=CAMNT_0007324751 /DNA_START=508 /DNA_END=1215 /DNA_ORIENTATION=-